MQDPATGKSAPAASPVDTDVDPHTPIWNELAPDWAAVQAVLAEEVPADAPA